MNTRGARQWLVACSAAAALFYGFGVTAQIEPTSAERNDGQLGMGGVSWEAEQYWFREQYAELDQMFSRLANSDERLTDGRWRLAAIPMALGHHFGVHKDWDRLDYQIGDWRKLNPQSTAVDIVEAIGLRNAAWSARGTGYGSSVTPEGWKLFHERLQRAEAALLRSKERSSRNPLWYDTYLQVALGLGWDQPQFRRLYDEAVARFPEYHSYYFMMMRYLMPQWHGSIEEIDAYIAAVGAQGPQGKTLYARLYWAFDETQAEGFALFEETGAKWSDMRAGFEQMMEAWPDSAWNLNHFAAFACRANDAATYRKLRMQIGDRPYVDAFPSNFTIEICDARLLKAR